MRFVPTLPLSLALHLPLAANANGTRKDTFERAVEFRHVGVRVLISSPTRAKVGTLGWFKFGPNSNDGCSWLRT